MRVTIFESRWPVRLVAVFILVSYENQVCGLAATKLFVNSKAGLMVNGALLESGSIAKGASCQITNPTLGPIGVRTPVCG